MAENFAELGRVQAIRQLFEGSGFEPFGEPLWLTAGQQECITTASGMMLEGIDFDLVYFPLPHLGRKAVLKVTGELYAVMAHPDSLSVQLGVSAKLDFPQIKELWSGIVSAAKEHGYRSLGLDLQPSKNGLTIALAATGRHSASVSAARPQARSKDLVCVSGPLGAAYLGLQALQREKANFDKGASNREALERYKMLVGAYLKPDLSAHTVPQLEEDKLVPSFGYFVTRGLADALLRLQRDSGLGVKVYADKMPFEGGSFDLGRELDLDPISAAMNGGEDFRLLYVVPLAKFDQFRKDFQTFDIIGHLAQPEAGAVLVTPDGVELPLKAQGW
ncbi:MAG: hypothetical protein IKS71_06220 [Bacteroidales bacterium]|nr:hypothetical protein [Bacteroidales bacterium]